MAYLFETFAGWDTYCREHNMSLVDSVIEYETSEKGTAKEEIMAGVARNYQVMKEAVETGFSEDMTSRSGMINNGAKKVYNSKITVLSPEFQQLVARALSAKEVNSCMGRVVAAPTAGASGIMPGVLYTLQQLHGLSDEKMHEAMLVAAGIALVIEHQSSLAGAVGGCQAETGSAAAMAAGAIVYCLGGDNQQIFNAVGITIQCMLGLVCDPVACLVEVPCVVRNASAAAIAFSSAQMAMAGLDAVIPADECVAAMGEVGESMEARYKETALGGLAATPTGKRIAQRVLVHEVDILPDMDEE
ncbi:MAG TPA: L-serine ammonia-lyase, iron-sulfur-dependent, subunit alpha [Flammeovirgaceae bacterium]|nr:L-serine ammonia-lyase, iron-sulfur-dependent, subunit alpha [Flammeovirgaceae bacterium]